MNIGIPTCCSLGKVEVEVHRRRARIDRPLYPRAQQLNREYSGLYKLQALGKESSGRRSQLHIAPSIPCLLSDRFKQPTSSASTTSISTPGPKLSVLCHNLKLDQSS